MRLRSFEVEHVASTFQNAGACCAVVTRDKKSNSPFTKNSRIQGEGQRKAPSQGRLQLGTHASSKDPSLMLSRLHACILHKLLARNNKILETVARDTEACMF